MRQYKTDEYSFTESEKSFIDGLLLGDGFINKSNFSLGLNTASKEFAEYVLNSLPRKIWTNSGIIKTDRYDDRIKKTLTIYRIVTHSNLFFEKERTRWYDNNGKKRIPKDIKINNISALIWYLGDGTLSQNYKYERTSEIKLCTNSFSKEEIEKILITQLNEFSPHVRIINGKEPIISIPRKTVEPFLRFIGKPPFNEYSHKWNVFPYKRKKVEKYGVTYTDNETRKNILKEYIKGNTVSDISKKYNMHISHVIYFCKKANLYDKDRDKKTYKIYENGVLITETKNLKQYCLEHNMCYSNMLKLCSGKIKKYKNYSINKL